jgi:UDP-N-acetyl-2-amino-2-deoxyglucuronate dehydrogenase
VPHGSGNGSTQPVRVAVLGLGDIGRVHAELLSEMPDYELVAVADADAAAAEGLQALAGGARGASLADALAQSSPDAVVIATPPSTHADLAAEALRAGAHVYCEKPLALEAATAASVVALADDLDRRVYVGMQWRHRPGYAAARRAIAEGAIGAVRRCEVLACNWFRSRRHFARRPWRASWDGSGGGVVMSQAIHQLDVLCWLLGAPLEVAAEIGRTGDDVEVEAHAVADVRFASGATARVVVRSIDFVGNEVILVHGDRGTIALTRDRVRIVSSEVPVADASSGTPRTERVLPEAPVTPSLRELLGECHSGFLTALRAPHAEDRESGRDAVRTLELVNGIYYAALTGAEVRLPVPANDYSALLERLSRGCVRVPRRAAAYLPAVGRAPLA